MSQPTGTAQRYHYYVVFMYSTEFTSGISANDAVSLDRQITDPAHIESVCTAIRAKNPEYTTVILTNWILLRVEPAEPFGGKR